LLVRIQRDHLLGGRMVVTNGGSEISTKPFAHVLARSLLSRPSEVTRLRLSYQFLR